jgi:hypothetical protein
VEAVVVAFSGEVNPLWVAKLISHEVEVALAAECLGDQTDHLMQSYPSVDSNSFLLLL